MARGTPGDPCPLLIEFKISIDVGNFPSGQIRCDKLDIFLFSQFPVLFTGISSIGNDGYFFFLCFL